MVRFSRAARLTVWATACLVVLGAAPAASWGQKTVVAKVQAVAASDGAIRVTGTRLADTLTVLRREGTRFVQITADRPIVAGEGCTADSSTQVQCIPVPIAIDPIRPPPGVVFFGVPVVIQVSLGDGADTLTFLRSTANDATLLTAFGQDGADRMSAAGRQGPGTGAGNRSPVLLFGDSGDDALAAGPGDDQIFGGAGDDVLAGNAGDDVLAGFAGDDILLGLAGADRLFGGAEDDVLSGGPGSDVLIGGVGGDVLSGGSDAVDEDNRDEVQYQDFTVSSPLPSATLVPVPRAGIQVGVGDSICMDGGPEDIATGSRPRAPFATGCGRLANGLELDEVLADVEIVSGTEADDTVIGGPAPETIFGSGGTDQLEGGVGSDTLIGGTGSDTLLLRDQSTDAGALCGDGARDRALTDKLDPVDPSCELVDRGDSGGQGTTGGVVVRHTVETEVKIVIPGATPNDPVTERSVAVEQPAPAGSPPTGRPTGGPGPGGGDGGRRPPEAHIVSRALTIDRHGRAGVLITCTYRAQACVGTVTLTTGDTVGRGRTRVGRAVRVSRMRVTIPWGRTEVLRVPLDQRFRRALADRRTRVVLRVDLRDEAAARTAATVRLRRTMNIARVRR